MEIMEQLQREKTGFLEPELTGELYGGNSKNIQCYRLERPTAFYWDASSPWTQWEVSSVLVGLPYLVVSLIGLFCTYFVDPVLLKRSSIGKPQVAGSDSIIIGFKSKKNIVVSPTRGCTK
ncbi:uncharacterized protein LOC134220023 [Armigeres subalbatus]|uniref:uncharacterized protein LOC134220023 n=1 Tax=Armigeres subalbatus TaxID=124917 RepID=UPI002ED4A611